MELIATYSKTREIIERNSFFIKKGYGQNFLIDQHVINKILNGADISKDDLIIEIGPGIGGLTEQLAINAGKVICVEIDKELIPILENNLRDYENVEIINSDVLKTDLTEIIKNSGFSKAKLVANLPYYITTPIIMDVLEKKVPVESLTVMIQKEVAARIAASAGNKDYGSLSVSIGYYAAPYLIANVPRNCFIPRPNVDSAVIKLSLLDKPPVDVNNEKLMFSLIRAAFGQRRKTLVNCIFNICNFGLSKEKLGEILSACGFDINIRGENLTLFDYALISDEIEKHL